MRLTHIVSGLLLACAPMMARADDMASIVRDYAAFAATVDPVRAGEMGDAAARTRWPDVTPTAIAAQTAQLQGFAKRLDVQASATLSADDALNRALLEDRIATELAGRRFDEPRTPFITGDGFYTVADYAAFNTRIDTAADARAWMTRLSALPDFYAANVANMRRGIATGFTQTRIATESAISTLRAQLAAPASASSLMVPFRTLPASMPKAEAEALRAEALAIVETRVRPAQRATLAFLETDYLPHARPGLGAATLPDGKAYYAWLVRHHTTTAMSPAEIHTLGLSEIARIRGEMATEMAAAGFKGTLPEFLTLLRTDPQFYATSVDGYVAHAAEIAKRVDLAVPGVIGRLPRLTFGFRILPPEVGDSSNGYLAGNPALGIAGGVMIHGTKVLKFPLFQLPSWVMHEGVPGHHTQIALAQELEGLPAFRRADDLTAYVEGWALYTEWLGVEMGIYRTPYERFGRLSYEAWRAARLVIDTGIHDQGWSRQQAIDFLTANTALSAGEISGEVDRYIGWPGQALAYKVGELTIRRLRTRAETALGPKFDVRRFHDAVLDSGPMPLAVLDQQLASWQVAEARR
ncbi:DUF885 domain-containing protein [Polymorphobacter arshaanensis]|nr:DUF885 domain-containing protein [Polymorphobacter arshaanensis]